MMFKLGALLHSYQKKDYELKKKKKKQTKVASLNVCLIELIRLPVSDCFYLGKRPNFLS